MVIGMSNYWVYILLCDNHSYYTGYTNDITRRYQSHVTGTGKCKYTRSFKPIGIAQCWEVVGDKAMAMKIERFIKKLTRIEKENLIKKPKDLIKFYDVNIISKMKIKKLIGKIDLDIP